MRSCKGINREGSGESEGKCLIGGISKDKRERERERIKLRKE